MENILDYAKRLVKSVATERPIFIDFTMGNGNDTLFLTNISEKGHVFAFDIQQTALENTELLLKNHHKNNYTLILDSHANIKQYIHKKFDAGIFNLGYLPKGDKSITTKSHSTLKAIADGLELLKIGGLLCIVIYVGHPEGSIESDDILSHTQTLDPYKYNVILHRSINHKTSPYIIAIEKRKE